MGDVFDKVNDATDRLTQLLSNKQERVTKGVINFILLVVILGVFGCFDFLTMRFNFDVFDFVGHQELAASYWTEVITKAIAGVCAYNIGMNINWEREVEKSFTLKDLIRRYNDLEKMRDGKTFNDFVMNVYNLEEKRKAWVDSINKKIHRLNRFAKHGDLILYSSEDEQGKKKSRYCQRRAELEEMKTEGWIDKNIGSVFVRYRAVDPIVFSLDIECKTESRGAKVQGNVAMAKARNSASVVFGMLAISMFLASFALSASKEKFVDQMQAFWYYALKLLEDIGVVLWQVFRGMLDDRKLVNSELIAPYAGRIKVLEAYVSWCAENKVEKSPAFEIMKALDEEGCAEEPQTL